MGRPRQYIAKATLQAVRERDGDICRYCGIEVDWEQRTVANGATYDHVDPQGDDSEENLVVACWRCNQGKRDGTAEGWRAILSQPPCPICEHGFVATVGGATLQVVKQYVENQRNV